MMAHYRPLFSLFSSFQQLAMRKHVHFKILPMTGFERAPLVLEVTALPTEPQSLPKTQVAVA